MTQQSKNCALNLCERPFLNHQSDCDCEWHGKDPVQHLCGYFKYPLYHSLSLSWGVIDFNIDRILCFNSQIQWGRISYAQLHLNTDCHRPFYLVSGYIIAERRKTSNKQVIGVSTDRLSCLDELKWSKRFKRSRKSKTIQKVSKDIFDTFDTSWSEPKHTEFLHTEFYGSTLKFIWS